MGSTPNKENMESKLTLLLSSVRNETKADRPFLSNLFLGYPRDVFFQGHRLTPLWRPGEKKTNIVQAAKITR